MFKSKNRKIVKQYGKVSGGGGEWRGGGWVGGWVGGKVLGSWSFIILILI